MPGCGIPLLQNGANCGSPREHVRGVWLCDTCRLRAEAREEVLRELETYAASLSSKADESAMRSDGGRSLRQQSIGVRVAVAHLRQRK